MTYDKATQTIVLFGGDIEQYGCCDVFYGDTWTCSVGTLSRASV